MQVDFKKKALLEWAKPYLARSGENSKTGIIIIDIVTTIIITTVMMAYTQNTEDLPIEYTAMVHFQKNNYGPICFLVKKTKPGVGVDLRGVWQKTRLYIFFRHPFLNPS